MNNQDVFKKIENSIDSLKINETEKKALLEGVLRLKKPSRVRIYAHA